MFKANTLNAIKFITGISATVRFLIVKRTDDRFWWLNDNDFSVRKGKIRKISIVLNFDVLPPTLGGNVRS